MIPTVNGPLCLKGMKDFIKVRGGGYFFHAGEKGDTISCALTNLRKRFKLCATLIGGLQRRL